MSTPHGTPPGSERPSDGHQPPPLSRGDAPDDHGGGGGVDPQALKAGHEPETFNIKEVMSVPLAVVVSFVIAYGVVTAVFRYVQSDANQPKATNPLAAERNKDTTLNQRLSRIDQEKGEVKQPRLEFLKQVETEGNPPYLRTFPPTNGGNSPHYHPEDLRPSNVPEMNDYAWVDQTKGAARIPIDAAMAAALKMGVFKTQDRAVDPAKQPLSPKLSNSGRGPGPGPSESKK